MVSLFTIIQVFFCNFPTWTKLVIIAAHEVDGNSFVLHPQSIQVLKYFRYWNSLFCFMLMHSLRTHSLCYFIQCWRQWGGVKDIRENFLSYRTLLLLSIVNDWETQTGTAALRYVEGYSDTPVNVHNQKISSPVRGSSEDGAVEETSLYRQKCQFSGWWTLRSIL